MERSSCKNSYNLTEGEPLWSLETLEGKISSLAGMPVTIHLNSNRSTYLRLLEKSSKGMKISLQKFFLYAPDEICQALVNFLLKKPTFDKRKLRHFACCYFEQVDLSAGTDQEKLWYQGEVFDLKKIFDRVNEDYFQNTIENLSICYFPEPHYKKCRSITWGLYDKPARMIRINSLLDNSITPPFFVDFIVYHEMLHHICPPKLSGTVRTIYHTPQFRRLEKTFPFYEKAKDWEKQFFATYHKKMRTDYGRT